MAAGAGPSNADDRCARQRKVQMKAKIGAVVAASLAVVSLVGGAEAANPSARDIFLRQEEARKIRDIQAEASITTGGPGGDSKLKTFTWWRKLGADNVHFRTLTRFHLPAEIR